MYDIDAWYFRARCLLGYSEREAWTATMRELYGLFMEWAKFNKVIGEESKPNG